MAYISKINTKGVGYSIADSFSSGTTNSLTNLPYKDHIDATLSGATQFSITPGSMKPGERMIITCHPTSSFKQELYGKTYQICNKRTFRIYVQCISDGVYSTVLIENTKPPLFDYNLKPISQVKCGDLYFEEGFDSPENVGDHNPKNLKGIVIENKKIADKTGDVFNECNVIYIWDLKKLEDYNGNLLSGTFSSTGLTINLTKLETPKDALDIITDNNLEPVNDRRLSANYDSAYAENGYVYGYYNNLGTAVESTSANGLFKYPTQFMSFPSNAMISTYKSKFQENLLGNQSKAKFTSYLATLRTLKYIKQSDVKTTILNSWEKVCQSLTGNTTPKIQALIDNDIVNKYYNTQISSSSTSRYMDRTTNVYITTILACDMRKPLVDIELTRDCIVTPITQSNCTFLPINCVYSTKTTNTPKGQYAFQIKLDKIDTKMRLGATHAVGGLANNIFGVAEAKDEIINWFAFGAPWTTKSGSFTVGEGPFPKVITVKVVGDGLNTSSSPGMPSFEYKSIRDVEPGDILLKNGGIISNNSAVAAINGLQGNTKQFVKNIARVLNIDDNPLNNPVSGLCMRKELLSNGKIAALFLNVDELFHKTCILNPADIVLSNKPIAWDDRDVTLQDYETDCSMAETLTMDNEIKYLGCLEKSSWDYGEGLLTMWNHTNTGEKFNIPTPTDEVKEYYKKHNLILPTLPDTGKYTLAIHSRLHSDYAMLFTSSTISSKIMRGLHFALHFLSGIFGDIPNYTPDRVGETTVAFARYLFKSGNIYTSSSVVAGPQPLERVYALDCKKVPGDQNPYSTAIETLPSEPHLFLYDTILCE